MACRIPILRFEQYCSTEATIGFVLRIVATFARFFSFLILTSLSRTCSGIRKVSRFSVFSLLYCFQLIRHQILRFSKKQEKKRTKKVEKRKKRRKKKEKKRRKKGEKKGQQRGEKKGEKRKRKNKEKNKEEKKERKKRKKKKTGKEDDVYERHVPRCACALLRTREGP